MILYKLLKWKLMWVSALLFFAGVVKSTDVDNQIKIRVAVLEGVNAFEVAGERMLLFHRNGETEIGNRVDVACDGDMIKIGETSYEAPLRVKAKRDIFYINEKQYKGDLVIHMEHRDILVVNELPLETYLVGLINAEMNSKWHLEAVKAQAVVARTFAMKKMEERRHKNYDVKADVSDQVYHGSSLEDEESELAVAQTAGEVLLYRGELANAFYHSTCGGHTASSQEVWGRYYPYLIGVECQWCVDSPRYFWKYEISGAELGTLLQKKDIVIGEVKKIKTLGKTPSGRVSRVEIVGSRGKRVISATVLRTAVGYTKIFSTRFEVNEPEKGKFVFVGGGSGHGVGMCQWGARGMALAGKTYKEILEYYYPGIQIGKHAYQ